MLNLKNATTAKPRLVKFQVNYEPTMLRRIILMGLVTTILNLVGCSGQTKKEEGKFSKEMEEQIASSIKAFNNSNKDFQMRV